MKKKLIDLVGFKVSENPTKNRMLDNSSLEYIPQMTRCDEILGELRNRFCVNGLIDNVVLTVNSNSANLLGLWMAGISLQANFSKYKFELTDSTKGITDIWCEIESDSQESKKETFVWDFEESFDFTNKLFKTDDEKFHFSVTNYNHNWITMDDFYQRNVLLGFGSIKALRKMASLFLNIGSSSSVGYITLKHLEEKNQIEIADSDSCEFRIEVE